MASIFSSDKKPPSDSPIAESPRVHSPPESRAVEEITRVASEKVTLAGVADVEGELKALARKIRGAKKKAVEAVLTIGEALTTANELLADHAGGSFGKWLKQEAGISRSSAHRYMKAHSLLGRCPSVEQRNFELQAVYALADGKTPRQAVDDCLQLATDGEKITGATARKIISSYVQPKADGRPAPIIIDLGDKGKVVVHRPHDFSSVDQILSAALRQIQDKAAA